MNRTHIIAPSLSVCLCVSLCVSVCLCVSLSPPSLQCIVPALSVVHTASTVGVAAMKQTRPPTMNDVVVMTRMEYTTHAPPYLVEEGGEEQKERKKKESSTRISMQYHTVHSPPHPPQSTQYTVHRT